MKKAGAYSDLGERALASEKKRPLEAVCATADDAVAYDRGRIGKGIQQHVDGHAEAERDKDDPPSPEKPSCHEYQRNQLPRVKQHVDVHQLPTCENLEKMADVKPTLLRAMGISRIIIEVVEIDERPSDDAPGADRWCAKKPIEDPAHGNRCDEMVCSSDVAGPPELL